MILNAVGFDYYGVINGMLGSVFNRLASQVLDVSEADFLAAFYAHNQPYKRGEINDEQLWEQVLATLNRVDRVRDILTLSRAMAHEKTDLQILELVDKLRHDGLKVGLLCNATYEAAQQIRSLEIDKHFDVFHVSSETGFDKPQRESFQHLAEALGVSMNHLIFVDDSQRILNTAAELGVTPVLYENYDDLRRQLSELGVLPDGIWTRH